MLQKCIAEFHRKKVNGLGELELYLSRKSAVSAHESVLDVHEKNSVSIATSENYARELPDSLFTKSPNFYNSSEDVYFSSR